MTWFAVGGAVVGAAGSFLGSSKASKAQQKAADAALEEQRRQYDLARSDNMPALDARNNALDSMQNLARKYGGGVPTAEQVMAQPGYQFGLDQGRNALENSAAARGGLYSGKTGRDLTKFANDYGTSKYTDAFNQMQTAQTNDFNRWASISGNGQTGANAINTAGQNYANNAGSIGMSNANAQGAASIANANTFGDLAGKVESGLNKWFGQPGTGGGYGANPAPSGGYSDGVPDNGTRGGYADGGPVREEPKVGTRSPLPQGETGGGMSNNAIIKMLIQQNLEKRKTQQGVNFLNPRAVLQDQEARANMAHGGAVPPGPPGRDTIPANLDNGEHVMDAASVTALGGGDNELGQMRLNKLRAMLKGAC